jgi:hypothetical protein
VISGRIMAFWAGDGVKELIRTCLLSILGKIMISGRLECWEMPANRKRSMQHPPAFLKKEKK